MSEVQSFTDFLDNIDYPYEILDTDENLKAAISIEDNLSIFITWLQNSTPAFEIEFPMVEKKVTCNNFTQVQKNLNLYMSTKQPNFENILQLVNDMFCQQNGIDWTSTFINLIYDVDDENNLNIIACFTEDDVTNDSVNIEVKSDYFIVKLGNIQVCYRYEANKNMAIKLPSLETCINSLVKVQAANPDKFELEQTNPNQNIVVVFYGEPEIKVEFALGLCASSFLFETLYINDEEISFDFQLKQPKQIFDYREKCLDAYQEYLSKVEETKQIEQEQHKQDVVNSLDNLVLRLFPNEEEVSKDYISVENDYINLHLSVNTHELNIMWDVLAETPYKYELDTEDCGSFYDIDSLYDSISSKLAEFEEPSTEETTLNESSNESNTWNDDSNEETWGNSSENESWNETEADTSWSTETEEPKEEYSEETNTETNADNVFVADMQTVDVTPSIEPYSTNKNNTIGISLTESIQTVLQFTGANRSIRSDLVENAETEIKKILEPFSAAEILTIISHLM